MGVEYFDPTSLEMILGAYARTGKRTREMTFQEASEQAGYAGMYPPPSDSATIKNSKAQQWIAHRKKMRNGNYRHIVDSLGCIREAHEAGGAILTPELVAKKLVVLRLPDHPNDAITAVPSLSTDDVEEYAFYLGNGEVVQQSSGVMQALKGALATRASEEGQDEDDEEEQDEDDEGTGVNGDDDEGDDDDDDPRLSTPTNAGTNAGTGTDANANAAGDGIGGFATPPNAGSERQRGGTRSSGSSSSGARSDLSGIGSSIRNRRNRGRRNGKGAVRNLRELLRSPISASASRDGGHDHEGDDEDGDGGWEVDVESPAGRDPPPDDDATVEGGVPTDDGRTSTRGGLHGSPSYDGDNDDSDDGDDDDDDDDDLEVEFTIGIVSDDRRGRPRDGNHSLGTGTVHGTSRPTSPEESRVGRDPPSVGISEEGGGEDPPTLDDLVGPGASADLGMGNGSRSPVALTLPSAAENAGGGGAGNVANANIQDDEDAAPNVGATDAGIGVGGGNIANGRVEGVEETKEEEEEEKVDELGDGTEDLALGDDDNNNNNAIANAFGAGGGNGDGNNGGIGAADLGAGPGVEDPPEEPESGLPLSPGDVVDLIARVSFLEAELGKEKKEKKKLEKKLEKKLSPGDVVDLIARVSFLEDELGKEKKEKKKLEKKLEKKLSPVDVVDLIARVSFLEDELEEAELGKEKKEKKKLEKKLEKILKRIEDVEVEIKMVGGNNPHNNGGNGNGGNGNGGNGNGGCGRGDLVRQFSQGFLSSGSSWGRTLVLLFQIVSIVVGVLLLHIFGYC